MAKSGKNVVRQITVQGLLETAVSEAENLREEMCEWRDNLEEKLSHTEKYTAVSEAADAIEGADIEGLVELLIAAVEKTKAQAILGTEVSFSFLEPYKGKSLSRASRMSEASSMFASAIDEIRSALESEEEQITEEEKVVANNTNLRENAAEEAVRSSRDNVEEALGALSDVESAMNELEGVDFPGMYG